jgi:transcriptional regulator with XRE-family HTH domain
VTGAAYKALREEIGSQAYVAGLLGVHFMTVSKRERGANPVTREAEWALLYARLLAQEGGGRGVV